LQSVWLRMERAWPSHKRSLGCSQSDRTRWRKGHRDPGGRCQRRSSQGCGRKGLLDLRPTGCACEQCRHGDSETVRGIDAGGDGSRDRLFTQALSREVGSRGITVNNVQPGPIDTDLNPAAGDWAVPQKAATALDRYGHVDEIAAMVAFVAGPESSYITGANLTVDGGMNA
jgi:hypothetical protein